MGGGAPGRLTSAEQVCAVLVSYLPDAGLPARAARILREVGALVIVDNGSGEAAAGTLKALAGNPKLALIPNSINVGIARALNLGIERAMALRFDWVLLLDQDSEIDDGMVRALIDVHAAYPESSRLAVVGTAFRDVNDPCARAGGDALPIGSAGDSWREVESVITSGSLIGINTHAAIGPFREEFFIDYVDTEYCLRARARGYRVIQTRSALMSHAIGSSTRHAALWGSKSTTNHSPDRRYYIARNDTVMLREYAHYPCGVWALKSLGRRLRTCRRILLYERTKARKTMAVFAGWWDGMRGRMGPRAR